MMMVMMMEVEVKRVMEKVKEEREREVCRLSESGQVALKALHQSG